MAKRRRRVGRFLKMGEASDYPRVTQIPHISCVYIIRICFYHANVHCIDVLISDVHYQLLTFDIIGLVEPNYNGDGKDNVLFVNQLIIVI